MELRRQIQQPHNLTDPRPRHPTDPRKLRHRGLDRHGDGRELEFFVMSIDPEIVIANPAIGLQFRFRAEYYYRLITLRDEPA